MRLTELSASQFQLLGARWRAYLAESTFERYSGYALALNSFAAHAERLRMPGLMRTCKQLEQVTLCVYGDESTHPIQTAQIRAIERELDQLTRLVDALLATPKADAADDPRRTGPREPLPPRSRRVVWIVADPDYDWVSDMTEQLSFFGFGVVRHPWNQLPTDANAPLAMLLVPPVDGYGDTEIAALAGLRAGYATSQLFCLKVPKSLTTMVRLLRAGADVTVMPEEDMSNVLARVLALVQPRDETPAKVLVVEDSPTALAYIQRALNEHGIASRSIANPQDLITAIESYQPDLVLMDMHMPHCSGIEATRVIRQLAAYQALPVVYHSSETELSMQIDALRLGGDQFLSKPCNPLLLAAVVRTKIERYRDIQRSSFQDSLTGLINHTAAKTKLAQLILDKDASKDRLCVAMIDIDHFKHVNDTYGHPVGDQVIRSLAWLLKGRLRATDIVCRYGGEEFLVVLREADEQVAFAVLDRIREDFASMPHGHASATIRVTFSAGVSMFHGDESVAQLTKAADDALLAAKRAGRNRILRSSQIDALAVC